MEFNRSIIDLIQERYSCRTYQARPISKDILEKIDLWITSSPEIPFKTPHKLIILKATNESRAELSRLGTYGFIRNPAGFILGAINNSHYCLEDYGYLLECFILYTVEIGLGTCWLGGSFTRSTFSEKLTLQEDEILPAVVSIGYPQEKPGIIDKVLREGANAKKRLPWETLFFDHSTHKPLTQQEAGPYQISLEMVRLAPSASNLQPWRIVREGNYYHFCLKRKHGYRQLWISRLLRIEDLQRIDMGIAMCHFALTNHHLQLKGEWHISCPAVDIFDREMEYLVSWVGEL